MRKVLEAYRQHAGNHRHLRRPDRLLAAQLYQRGVPLTSVENALVLAAVRRLIRPATAPPLATVRSLAYFLPVIEEVLELKVSPDYFHHLRQRLQRFSPPDHVSPTQQPRLRRGMMMPPHLSPVPNPVPGLGHFRQAPLGHSWLALRFKQEELRPWRDEIEA